MAGLLHKKHKKLENITNYITVRTVLNKFRNVKLNHKVFNILDKHSNLLCDIFTQFSKNYILFEKHVDSFTGRWPINGE